MTFYDDLQEYASNGGGLITTASPYISDVVGCEGDHCSAKAFGLSESGLESLRKEASNRLVVTDPGSRVEKTWSGAFKSDNEDFGEIPEKSIMVYDAVLATKDKDRDGDIVHPEGMVLEAKMPLLWSHVWSSPIGVMVKTLEQDTDRVVGRYAIGDVAIGRDAATLVSMGAMRKSHGFLPLPGGFEPLGKKKDGTPSGFRLKKIAVYESSLVSVPAGAGAVVLRSYEKELDAIYDAFSGGKLESEPVQKWATDLYDSRKKMFKGATPEGDGEACGCKQPKATVGELLAEVVKSMGEKEEPVQLVSDGIDNKSLSMVMEDTLPGSFERVLSELSQSVRGKHNDEYSYTGIIATFSGTVIFCVSTYDRGKRHRKCYRSSWGLTDGVASLTGEAEEVEVQASVVKKHFSNEQEPIAVVGDFVESDPLLDLLGVSRED